MKRLSLPRLSLTLCAGLLLAAVCWEGSAQAQQVSLASYNDLLSRLESVESRLANERHDGGGCDACGPDCCDSCCDTSICRGGWYGMYEAVFVKPYFTQNQAFTIMDVPELPAGEDVQLVEFDWDMEHSPRFEVGYLSPCSGAGFRARYWNFDRSTSLSAADPGAGHLDIGLHDDPDIQISTSDNERVDATHAMELDVLDLEVMGRSESCWGYTTFSAGARYLRLEQHYIGNIVNNITNVFDENAISDHTFEGLGPTLAAEAVFYLGNDGWSAFANTRASVVFGESTLFQEQQNGAPNDTLIANNDSDLLAIFETQLGLQYDHYTDGGALVFVRFACEAQYWPSGGSGAYQNGEDGDGMGHDPREADMGLLGFSAALGANW